jgi:phospholipid/cholesterol/gamma-HCH transport system permease protein
VISIVGLFTGLVLGLQGFHVLGRFGSESLLGTLVSLTLIRELAPVLAALMIVGQAGSALAAELGIQRNSEQIDALEIMGVDAVAYLVTPRLVASLVVFPILTMLFSVVGLVGGYLSSSVFLGLDSGVYWAAVNSSVQGGDLFEAATKAIVFGITTVAICAYQGFSAHRRAAEKGARAVSAATTRAVVQASIAVLAADYAVTSFLV